MHFQTHTQSTAPTPIIASKPKPTPHTYIHRHPLHIKITPIPIINNSLNTLTYTEPLPQTKLIPIHAHPLIHNYIHPPTSPLVRGYHIDWLPSVDNFYRPTSQRENHLIGWFPRPINLLAYLSVTNRRLEQFFSQLSSYCSIFLTNHTAHKQGTFHLL